MTALVEVRPVILCGGGGTRLWPLSTAKMPKQFHALGSDLSLLQQTALRAMALTGRAPVIVASADHVARVKEQLANVDIEADSIIAEPCGRNTAPGIALAAFWLRRHVSNAIMWVLPSDHRIGDLDALFVAARDASQAAGEGSLATFGVKPTKPHTGYGYIRRGSALPGYSRLYRVAGFREKPDQASANEYVQNGEYYWNSGMFMFGAEQYLQELARYAPDIYDATNRSFCAGRDHANQFHPSPNFSECPANSIDYAVMEPTRDAIVAPLAADWSDVGSWASIWEIERKDENGNNSRGEAFFIDASNCLVVSPRTVAVIGLDDVVVVEAEQGMLVCGRQHAERVKHIGSLMEERQKRGREPRSSVLLPSFSKQELPSSVSSDVTAPLVSDGPK